MAKTLFNIRKETFPEHRVQGGRKKTTTEEEKKW
jgi:hypothetical protein